MIQDFQKMYEEFKPLYYSRFKLDGTPMAVFRNALLDRKIDYETFRKAEKFYGDKWEEVV